MAAFKVCGDGAVEDVFGGQVQNLGEERDDVALCGCHVLFHVQRWGEYTVDLTLSQSTRETPMSIQDAINAANDNIQNYVSAQRDPVMFNVNIALLNIAEGIQRLSKDLDKVERQQLKDLKTDVDWLPSKLRR